MMNDSSLIISWHPNNPSKFELLFDTKRDGDYALTFMINVMANIQL